MGQMTENSTNEFELQENEIACFFTSCAMRVSVEMQDVLYPLAIADSVGLCMEECHGEIAQCQDAYPKYIT